MHPKGVSCEEEAVPDGLAGALGEAGVSAKPPGRRSHTMAVLGSPCWGRESQTRQSYIGSLAGTDRADAPEQFCWRHANRGQQGRDHGRGAARFRGKLARCT